MATISYKIFKHHKKSDGTYNVKYCLTHKGKQVYHSSKHHVAQGQLKKDLTLRDHDVLDDINDELKAYRKKISSLSAVIDSMDAKQLLQHITRPEESGHGIDFIAYCREYVETLKKEGRLSSARTMGPVVNNLIDFFGTESVPITEINSINLRKFEAYLKKPRKQVRKGNRNQEVTYVRPGLDASGIHTTMRDLRIMFNLCKRDHNSEFNQVITHAPFEYYKIPPAPSARKKGQDLNITDLVKIRDMKLEQGTRVDLARGIFMLSFYLCGMNLMDIYKGEWEISGGRLGYSRSKTERRKEGSYVSVSIPAPARPLLEQFNPSYLQKRYSGYSTILRAMREGMKQLSDLIGKETTFYHARHTFATLAHNTCGFSKEDVAAALNHVNRSTAVTERYIAQDWSAIDRVQAGVLGLLPL